MRKLVYILRSGKLQNSACDFVTGPPLKSDSQTFGSHKRFSCRILVEVPKAEGATPPHECVFMPRFWQFGLFGNFRERAIYAGQAKSL